MIIVKTRKGCKIRIDGMDAGGKVTTRSFLIADANVDEVCAVIESAVRAEGLRKLAVAGPDSTSHDDKGKG